MIVAVVIIGIEYNTPRGQIEKQAQKTFEILCEQRSEKLFECQGNY